MDKTTKFLGNNLELEQNEMAFLSKLVDLKTTKRETEMIYQIIEFIHDTPFGEVTLNIHTDQKTQVKSVNVVLGNKLAFKIK